MGIICLISGENTIDYLEKTYLRAIFKDKKKGRFKRPFFVTN